MQSCAFAAQHQSAAYRKIKLVVVHGAALIQADDPQVALFQLFQGAYQVHDPGNLYVLRCAGRSLDRYRAERRRPALRDHHSVYARALRRAQQGPQVLRIFHPVERQEQAVALVALKQVVQVQELPLPHDGHHPLVRLCPGQLGELVAGIQPHPYPRIPAGLDELLQAYVLPLAGNANVVKFPRPGP